MAFFFLDKKNLKKRKIGYGQTSSYQGYYWTPKMAYNGPKKHNKRFFFAQMAKKTLTEGQSPPLELEVGPCSGSYLLFFFVKISLQRRHALFVEDGAFSHKF